MLLLVVFLFSITLFLSIYGYKFLCLSLNNILHYSSRSLPQYNYLVSLGLPESILCKIKDLKDCENNCKHIMYYLNNINSSEKSIKELAFCSNKQLIVFIGENGAGKTTSLFGAYKYFLEYCDVSVGNLDFYKGAFNTFESLVNDYNASYIVCNKDVSFKAACDDILNKFSCSEYAMLLLDTSGKNMENHNLKDQTKYFISRIRAKCEKLKINCTFIYVLNTSVILHPSSCFVINLSDFIILAHLNFNNFNILNIVKLVVNMKKILGYLCNSLPNRFCVFNKKELCFRFADALVKLDKKLHNV